MYELRLIDLYFWIRSLVFITTGEKRLQRIACVLGL